MIIGSGLNFFIDTVPEFHRSPGVGAVETACTVFFTLEVATRTFIATINPRRMMLRDPTYWIDVAGIVLPSAELPAKFRQHDADRGPARTCLPLLLRR